MLTEEEQNLIKDLLKELDRYSPSVKRVAASMRIPPREVEDRMDVIFRKLGNGRLNLSGE